MLDFSLRRATNESGKEPAIIDILTKFTEYTSLKILKLHFPSHYKGSYDFRPLSKLRHTKTLILHFISPSSMKNEELAILGDSVRDITGIENLDLFLEHFKLIQDLPHLVIGKLSDLQLRSLSVRYSNYRELFVKGQYFDDFGKEVSKLINLKELIFDVFVAPSPELILLNKISSLYENISKLINLTSLKLAVTGSCEFEDFHAIEPLKSLKHLSTLQLTMNYSRTYSSDKNSEFFITLSEIKSLEEVEIGIFGMDNIYLTLPHIRIMAECMKSLSNLKRFKLDLPIDQISNERYIEIWRDALKFLKNMSSYKLLLRSNLIDNGL